MARNKVVSDLDFFELHNLMEDMPKKPKETWQEYAQRVNLRTTCSANYSPDTLQRIRKAKNPEEYREIIRKKHPVKEKPIQLEIPIVKDKSLEAMYDEFFTLFERIHELWTRINEEEGKRKCL